MRKGDVVEQLLAATAGRAARYLASLAGRGVAPGREAVARLAELSGAWPERGSDPVEILALLDEIGSPATVASVGGRYFGFGTHMWGIRSYRKLTGEGINLLDGEMIRILEEELPSRYGGDPHDYQLHEREDPDGFTRLVLVVDPRIDLPDEADVVNVLLDTLAAGDLSADSAREHWRQGASFRIERREPLWLDRGKMPSLVVHRV